MENSELRNKLFDTILETAVKDSFQPELGSSYEIINISDDASCN